MPAEAGTAFRDYVVVQGLPLINGKPGIRKEFLVFSTTHPEKSIEVSLFIRALQRFYDIPYTDRLSHFQIAGIHGYPGDLPWDNSAAPAH